MALRFGKALVMSIWLCPSIHALSSPLFLKRFQAMNLSVQMRLCLGDMVIPIVKESLMFLDLHSEAEAGMSEDRAEWLLVNFAATGDLRWLEKGLNMGLRWWVKNSKTVPLLIEILDVIDSNKHKLKGRDAKLPKHHNTVVAIRIRNEVIFVKNSSTHVVVAFNEGHGQTTMAWLVAEFQKDISVMSGVDEGPPQKLRKIQMTLEPTLDMLLQSALTPIQKHENCQCATWVPSRTEFRVKNYDNVIKSIRVNGFHRLRVQAEERGLAGLEDQISRSQSMAIQFLDHKVPAPLQDDDPPTGDGDDIHEDQ